MQLVEKKHQRTLILPAAVATATAGLGLFEILLFYLNRETAVPPGWGSAGGVRQDAISWFDMLQPWLLQLILSIFGLLILRRGVVPRIGALFLAIGLLSAGSGFLFEYAIYGFYSETNTLPGAALAAWVANFSWVFLFGLTLYLLAIFPNGRFLSRRWQAVAGILLLLSVALLTTATMIQDPLTSAFQIPNPFFQGYSPTLAEVLYTAGNAGIVLSILVVTLAVIQRFRLSQGRERQQMKWLLAGVVFMALAVMVGFILSFGFGLTIGELLINTLLLWPLVGIGMAMVRHRLYDIDFIIRRTLQYALLTGLLGLIYFGSVVVLQSVFTAVTGQASALSIVLSTLLIAALFTPLRRRIQAWIDRRFFRRKYDAQQVLARFAQTAQDETDAETLTARLEQVVQETIQPETIGIWLKANEP